MDSTPCTTEAVSSIQEADGGLGSELCTSGDVDLISAVLIVV